MGGNAFSATLPTTVFPRIPPKAYHALKLRISAKIKTLYAVVSTPAEAPEKLDHGDLDLLVCEPFSGNEVPHEEVQALLGATYVVPAPGNRTSSYAIRIEQGDWAGNESEEQQARQLAEGQDIFYQVDVHVCADKAEWERIHFFHAYGDLGMILGLLVRTQGLALGTKGLKAPNVPHAPFDLSDSMDEIIAYMGLSMERWRAGFATKREVFEWVATSTFFDPTTFRAESHGIKKVKPGRKMYAEFAVWAVAQRDDMSMGAARARTLMSREARREHALRRFGKWDEYERIRREDAHRELIKTSWNGTKVREWTGIPVHCWQDVKRLMTEVRAELGGDEGIVLLLEAEGEDALKAAVLRIWEKSQVEIAASAMQDTHIG
ncbi:hypothetical protein MKEN_00364100 [Mycena kentingensis (nom. inval.)]|nr:hypothetical protein MKEN_00364100 [Mycena kentingensis (nom. inval.)]